MRREDNTEPTMELIEAKSHWDGDCLIWDGSVTHKAPHMREGGRVVSVRRWIAINVLKRERIEKLFATFTCGNPLCVNPEHIAVVTRAKLQQMHSDRLQYGKNPVRRKKLAMARRAKTRFTQADIDRVRAWTGSQRALAREMGVNFDWINKVQRGVIWKDHSNNPFSGLGAR